VNLTYIICRTTDVVLHKAAAFHDRYLGDSVTNLYTHLVSANRTTIALTTFTAFDDFSINFWSAQNWSATGTRFSTTTAATLLVAGGLTI
jgi:hypothetical protein